MIGTRHRTELGNIDALMRSIQRVGLLQPVTITPDGLLVCGRRRLEAVSRLGWRTLKVWVRSGISDELSRLLAERDENEQRKDLNELELARLYDEISKLLGEDGARRQAATRFGGTECSPEVNGGGDSPPPHESSGKTRDQASKLITGSASYHRHEQVNAIVRVAEDPNTPAAVRLLARDELDAIKTGAKVYGSYMKVKAALALAAAAPQPDDPAPNEIELTSEAALARVRQERARSDARDRMRRRDTANRRTLRAFVLTWGDLDGWSQHYDPTEVGQQLSDADWAMFVRVHAETQAFAAAARDARAAKPQLTSA